MPALSFWGVRHSGETGADGAPPSDGAPDGNTVIIENGIIAKSPLGDGSVIDGRRGEFRRRGLVEMADGLAVFRGAEKLRAVLRGIGL